MNRADQHNKSQYKTDTKHTTNDDDQTKKTKQSKKPDYRRGLRITSQGMMHRFIELWRTGHLKDIKIE